MSETKQYNYEQLCEFIDPEETCDKDGELKQGAILEYMSKYPDYFVATIWAGTLSSLEYVPTDDDHPVLGLDKDRQYLPGDVDLSISEHLLEFVDLFKDAAFRIHVDSELGSIFILTVDWQ